MHQQVATDDQNACLREQRRGEAMAAAARVGLTAAAAAADEQATATSDEWRTATSEQRRSSATAGDRTARHSPHQRRFHLAQRRKERRTSRPLAAMTDVEHSARSRGALTADGRPTARRAQRHFLLLLPLLLPHCAPTALRPSFAPPRCSQSHTVTHSPRGPRH